MSLIIFAGSMEFIAANLLLVAFNPIHALFLTLMVNARHLFYGISMLDKYKGTGKKKVLSYFLDYVMNLFLLILLLIFQKMLIRVGLCSS